MTEQYTEHSPQSHQCGRIAHSVQRNDELKYVVVGVVVGETAEETTRHLNYNAILTHADKSIEELHEVVKQSLLQLKELTGHIA